ncbi:Uncharacterised protein [Acinetobacter baumannii]|nr:Uncharacterised protein [Acinetobacter baumannii]
MITLAFSSSMTSAGRSSFGAFFSSCAAITNSSGVAAIDSATASVSDLAHSTGKTPASCAALKITKANSLPCPNRMANRPRWRFGTPSSGPISHSNAALISIKPSSNEAISNG